MVVCNAMGWAWVTVQIGGVTYTFDPSAKLSNPSGSSSAATFTALQNNVSNVCLGTSAQPTATGYARKTGINLATATGYSQSSFISSAETGATITSTTVAGLNRTNTRNNLTTYSNNLVSWIHSNNPAAATADIIGGKSVNPLLVGTHQRWTSLPYICTSAQTSACGSATSYTTLPSTFRTTLTVTVPGASAVTFNSSDIYGHRLTVFANGSNQPVLALDGTAQATGTAATPGANLAITVSIVHPYQSTFANASGTLNVAAGSYYVIQTGWGPVGRGMIEKHRKLLLQNQQASPGTPTAEPVMGESLSVLGYTWLAELSQTMLTSGQIAGTQNLYQHAVGIAGIKAIGTGSAPYVDLPFNNFGVEQLASRPNTTSVSPLESSSFFAFFSMGSVLESGALEQTQPGETAVSTVKLLDLASQSDTIYDIDDSAVSGDNAAYWTSTIKPLLTPNYTSADLTRINSLVTSSGVRVIAPLHGNQAVNAWTGTGYFQLAQDGSSIGAIITGGLSGGFSAQVISNSTFTFDTTTSVVPAVVPSAGTTGAASSITGVTLLPSSAVGIDPLNLASGAFENDHTDLTVGSGSFPYSLSFGRHYDSSSGYATGPMGNGWTNSLTYTAKADSDGFAGLGQDSPVSGASALATLYVLQDIYNNGSTTAKSLDRLIIGAQAERWLMDQLTNNVVNVVQPGQVSQFVKLAAQDSAAASTYVYNAPLGSNATLTYSGTAYSLKTVDQNVLTFNGPAATNGPSAIATLHYAAGPTVTFTYTGANLSSVTNGMGRTLTLSYTGSLITGVSDGTRSIGFGYDASNNLRTFTDPASNVVTYAYGVPGQLTKVYYPSFPTNAFVTNTYDSLGRVAQQADALGHLTNVYPAGYRTETDDPAGTADVLYFAPRGQTLIHIDGLGETTTNAYDGIDRLTSTTLPEGNSTTYAYDNAHGVLAFQNVLSVTANPKPSSGLTSITTSFTYDPTFQKMKTATDGNGNVTTNTYDTSGGTGNLLETDQPTVGGVVPKTFYTYNARGQLLTKTDPVGKVTKMVYDTTTEELLSVTDDYSAGSGHLNLLTQFAYDGSSYDGAAANAIGNVTSTTDPNGNVTTTNYDALRRVTQVTAPTSTGAVTKTTYNADSMVTQVQRATGNVSTPWQTSSSTWSVSGKKLTDTDPNGYVTTYTYDTLDRLSTVTDPVSRVTTYGYDVLSRQISIKNTAIQSTPLAATTYSPNGKKATFTDANNNTTTYVYDGFDRLAQTQYPSTTRGAGTSDAANYEAVTSYDANSNPLTMRRRDGTVITLTYDVLNRPTQKTYSAGGTATFYSYDLDGRPLSALYTSTSGPGVSYAYDTAGRVSSETSSTSSQSHTISFQYDANGNRTRETWPDSLYVTYVYDALNRMTKVEENGATSGVGLLASYSYDPLSERTGVTRGNGTSTTYGYDAGSRLTSLAHVVPSDTSHATTLGFGYTNAGQLNSRSNTNGAYDWTNHPAATVNKTFDGLNRDATIVAITGGYDTRGNITADGARTFTYDADNKMTSVIVAATSTTATLSYDPLGRLQQDVDTGGTAATTLFLYEGGRLSAEYDGSGTMLRRYVHGPGTDEPVVWYEGSSTTDRRWLHANGQGSIVAQSNASGVVTQTYAYGAYGEPQAWGGSRFQYTGQIALPEAQLYHYKARAYDPTAGRFLQTDPIGYDGGANLYAYVGGDPLNAGDPTGHCSDLTYCYKADNTGDLYASGQGPDPMTYPDGHGGTEVQEVVVTAKQAAGPSLAITKDDVVNAIVLFSITPDGSEGSDADVEGAVEGGAMAGKMPVEAEEAEAAEVPASTPIGRSGNPIYVVPKANGPGVVSGVQYSGHAFDEMQGDGIPPSAVKNALDSVAPIPGKVPGTTAYLDPVNTITVITNSSTGRVITVSRGLIRQN